MAVSNKAATTRERIIFFDPFAKDVDLYCSIRAKRNEEIAQNGSILDSDYDDDYDSDINGYGEIEHHRADKSRITYTQQIPTPIRAKLKKAEVVEDLGIIRRGALGPHCLVVGQTVAACVPYDDSESSDSDNGSRERNKERWVIAVVLGFDKRRKLYTVKDKYGPSDDRRGEISWDIAPANVSRFPAARHPRCKPRDRVLALWSTKGSDAEGDSDKEKNEQDGDHDEEEWTSVFYDATVVETEERAGYITIDYGGSSGTRSVRVDKILAISGRQPRRPEKDRGDREQKQERDRAETEANSVVGRKKSKQERMDKETRDKQKESRDRAERSERETRDREKGDRVELHKDKDRGRNKGVKQQLYTLPPIDTRNMHAQDIKLLDDCHIRYYEHLLQNKASLELYEYLLEALPWKEESVKVMGAAFMESRFTVWFGDEPEDPTNNSARHAQVPGSRAPASPTAPSTRPDPWSTTVRELKAGAERVARSRFNVVTFTYQDGNDYVMTGTRDDEERPGGGTVASLALGSDSRVKLTHRTKPHKQDLTVTTGSLLLLEGATADNYIHVLPKLRGAGRILVTFRAIATPDLSPFAEISSYLAPNSARKRKWEAENGDDEEIDAHGDDDEGKDEGPTEFQCGDVPGVLPGTKFTNRNQLHEAGVHRILVGLVCGTESEGAESLLLAGGTNDQDFDNGNEVCVTGALMHTGKNKRKPNSSWKVIRGTQALITSCIRGLPVRIIRSHRLRSPYAPQSGFSYDGLYRVSQYWEEPAKGGQNVWRFKLCGPTPTSKPRLPPPTVVPGGSGPAHHAHGQHPSHSHMDHIDLTMGPPSPPMVPMGMGMGMGGGMNPIGLNMVGMGMSSHLHSNTSHKQHPPTHPDRSDSPSNRQSVLPLHSFTLPPPILSHPQNPSTLDPSPMHPLSPTLSPFHLRNTHPQQRSYLPPTPRRSMIDPFFLPNPVQQVHTLPPPNPTSQFSHNYPHPPLPSQYSAPHSHPHQQHAHPPHLPPPQYHPPFPSQYPAPPTLPRMWDELPKQ